MKKEIIKGLQKAIEISKKEIDQNQIEKFCNHIGVTQVYFKSETIDKIVTALEKEIDLLNDNSKPSNQLEFNFNG